MVNYVDPAMWCKKSLRCGTSNISSSNEAIFMFVLYHGFSSDNCSSSRKLIPFDLITIKQLNLE